MEVQTVVNSKRGAVKRKEVVKSSRSIDSIAKECYKKSDGDCEVAARLMRRTIERDDKLFRELLSPMIDSAVWSAITLVMRLERRDFKAGVVIDGQDDASALETLARQERNRWLDYPLQCGAKLGDADAEQLEDEIEQHVKFAASNSRQAEFYRVICKRIGTKSVRDTLNDNQIQKIWEKMS